MKGINFRAVGLDPGGTTGWMQFDAKHDSSGKILDYELTPLHFGPQDHHEDLYAALEHSHIHNYHLVYESFEFRQNDPRWQYGVNLMSREYIGVAKLFGQQRDLYGKKQIHALTAGQSKGFIPDKAKNGMAANAKLKAMGWYTPSMKHANDAARVLATWLITNGGKDFRFLIEGWKDL